MDEFINFGVERTVEYSYCFRNYPENYQT